MKISNFELVETVGSSPLSWVFKALVDVETGYLWWKKKERVKVQREYGAYWFFVENGEYILDGSIEPIARSWMAKTGQQT